MFGVLSRQVPSGAMVFALDSDLKTHGASFLSAGLSDMYAVHMNSGCTMKVFDSTFSGWAGTRVIFTEGELEMDSCDLRGRYVCIYDRWWSWSTFSKYRNYFLVAWCFERRITNGVDLLRSLPMTGRRVFGYNFFLGPSLLAQKKTTRTILHCASCDRVTSKIEAEGHGKRGYT